MSLISGNAIFGDDAVNCSSNSISGLAVFLDTAINNGSVTSAIFSDGAVNCGSLTSGTFLGTAINSGSVNVAEFFGTASNAGFVVESAKFADTSSNVGTVSGSAIFTDTSVSDGIVEGAVQLGVNVTEGENQALTETPTEYTQTDGFFPNAHYNSGVKAAPADYATVVHQVGSFWYKYDSNGDGSLASGNYSDGTSMFTFVNGIKGGAYTPSYNVLGLYYYVGTLTSGTSVLYSDNTLTTLASNITPFVIAGDARYSTDNSGVVTVENIEALDANYYYAGTLTSGTTVLYGDNGLTTPASNITPFVIAGDARYSTDNSGVVTIENIEIINSYYYTGTLTSGTTVLYSNDSLATIAVSITPFVIAGDAKYTTNSSGTITIENIVSAAFGGTTYYHIGTFGDGTELHTTDALNALAVSIGPINMGDISDPVDGLDDSFSTDGSGVVTITYGESSSSSTTINDVTYYYTGTLTSGSTVLYDDDALTTVASATRYAYTGSGATLYTIDNSGVYTAESISNTSINGVTYYYAGTLTSGSTVMYGEMSLDNLASAATYADTNAGIFYEIDANGVYTTESISSTTINSITYYYTGSLNVNESVLYDDNALTTVASATSFVDEGADILYTIDANGIYNQQNINTINDASSVTYYHIGTFGVGTTLYTNNALNSAAANLVSCNFGDLSSPPDGFDDFVSTDNAGYVCQIDYGTE
jgi:hypothetical protein